MSIHLFLAAAVAAAAQSQDPLAPLPAQSSAAAQPVMVEVPTPQPVPADPSWTAQPINPPPPAAVSVAPVGTTPQPPVVVVRIPKTWAEVFSAIRGSRWAEAQAGITTLPPNILTPVAKAELYTAKGSPIVSLGQIQALLAEAPDLPQADQLARMALTRGTTVAPQYIARRPIAWLGNSPSRYKAKGVAGEPAADQLRTQLDPLVKADDAINAELLVMQNAPYLSYEARAEAGQRVAWAYFAIGRDADARRVADTYRQAAGGEWASQSAWVSGLASWRLNDCNAASNSFREVATRAQQRELASAGYYWAARAEQACRRPRSVAPLLKAAATSPESFYGLLARETLGMDKRLPPDVHNGTGRIQSLANIRRAEELVSIGQPWLAEEMLKHQAQIGSVQDHHALIEEAKKLDLPSAQYWLAHNGQYGAVVDAVDRYPVPRWMPRNGWRIDPALALAHMRQESNFRANVVSPAGAVGLMQVLPTTANAMARRNGYDAGSLFDPTANIEYGQSFIETMRVSTATQGQLPKIIAAYNAGPLPVARWSYMAPADPLLWIESIPYWETRYYVPAVFRNLWVYQGMASADTPTLSALSQHRWPAFPSGRTNLAAATEIRPAGEP
ncbi:MAG: transglycosylase SLT domain-containing protein [Sphingomonas sp.]|nr:transglycosylase SLT domain-containing protein [Sphingomonas sp.]